MIIRLNAINFTSSKDSDKTCPIHTKSNNIEIMMGSEIDEINEELSESFLQVLMHLYYNLNKVSLSRSVSYMDSPKWQKNKKATINSKNNDHKCFQYAFTFALNYQIVKNNPERISKIKPFIDQYNWKDIDFLSHSKDWKKFESNNNSIALNILYVPHNIEKIRHAYNSKFNLNRENQVILLMIIHGEKWHFLL